MLRSLRTLISLTFSLRSVLSYKYHDTDKALACLPFQTDHRENLTIGEISHQLADDSELPMFRTAQKYLAAAKSHGDYLDVGCGTGRIISYFGGLFDRVTCVEADLKRISAAQRIWRISKWGRTTEVSFQNVRFGIEYASNESASRKRNRFDAITCMQVVQHVPEPSVLIWLRKMYQLLRYDGVLVLATKHDAVDKYTISEIGGAGDRPVSKQEFNLNAVDGSKGLSVHAFSANALEQLLVKAGFHVWEHTFCQFPHSGDGSPITQTVVAGKHWIRERPPTPPVTAIHVSDFQRDIRISQRHQCKTPCPGSQGGLTPADYLCF